ncbi:MAG: argininosuccinate lyase [Alphaproteobacteria bacterium]|nr:argininosuccinate lyase [Alphaproteobacteria bacterium]
MTLLDIKNIPQQTDELCLFINELEADKHLAPYEIAVQTAWVRGLARANLFSDIECRAIITSFDEALELLKTDNFSWNIRDEDMHIHLEKFITERNGDLGKRMHVGRSRNDLVATTLRLYVSNSCIKYYRKLSQFVAALTDKAEQSLPIIVPGTTHLQHGQPVYFAHILLAHAEAFMRDMKRLCEIKEEAMSVMPLGASAMAGTTLSIDLVAIANELGFKSPCRNSYDAVGDRDFILCLLDAFAKIALHLSRLSEDIVYWASTPVQLIELPPAWSTGSSIMPNKRNPEIAELTRGRSAHIIAAQTNGYMLMRTAPTSYSGEMQEIKGIVLRAQKNLDECFMVWPSFIKEMHINERSAKHLLGLGHILATEIADALTLNGIPFREAYAKVKGMVVLADERGCQVQDIWEADRVEIISIENAVEKCRQHGGTAKVNILSALQRNRKEIAQQII